MNYLIAAYIVFWLLPSAYLWLLWKKLDRLENKI